MATKGSETDDDMEKNWVYKYIHKPVGRLVKSYFHEDTSVTEEAEDELQANPPDESAPLGKVLQWTVEVITMAFLLHGMDGLYTQVFGKKDLEAYLEECFVAEVSSVDTAKDILEEVMVSDAKSHKLKHSRKTIGFRELMKWCRRRGAQFSGWAFGVLMKVFQWLLPIFITYAVVVFIAAGLTGIWKSWSAGTGKWETFKTSSLKTFSQHIWDPVSYAMKQMSRAGETGMTWIKSLLGALAAYPVVDTGVRWVSTVVLQVVFSEMNNFAEGIYKMSGWKMIKAVQFVMKTAQWFFSWLLAHPTFVRTVYMVLLRSVFLTFKPLQNTPIGWIFRFLSKTIGDILFFARYPWQPAADEDGEDESDENSGDEVRNIGRGKDPRRKRGNKRTGVLSGGTPSRGFRGDDIHGMDQLEFDTSDLFRGLTGDLPDSPKKDTNQRGRGGKDSYGRILDGDPDNPDDTGDEEELGDEDSL